MEHRLRRDADNAVRKFLDPENPQLLQFCHSLVMSYIFFTDLHLASAVNRTGFRTEHNVDHLFPEQLEERQLQKEEKCGIGTENKCIVSKKCPWEKEHSNEVLQKAEPEQAQEKDASLPIRLLHKFSHSGFTLEA